MSAMTGGLSHIAIETTNACNGHCVFCSHHLSKRPVVHMDLELYDKIVTEIEALRKVRPMSPTGMCGIGEPTLHPQFIDALEIVKRVPFTFGTNCHGVTDDQIAAVIKANPVGVSSLSLDATTPEVLKKMRPGLKFDKVVDSMQRFIDALRASNSPRNGEYCVQIVLSKLNVHQLQDYVDYWLPRIEGVKGLVIWIKWINAWPQLADCHQFYPTPPFQLSSDARKHQQVRIAPDLGTPAVKRKQCSMFWRFAEIKSDGSYAPCCMVAGNEFAIGNAQDNTVLELFNSPKMIQFRQWMIKGEMDKVPYCGNCR